VEKEKSELALCLQLQAEELMAAGLHESSITMLFSSLMLDPSRIPAIHKIGKCLEALGATEEAQLCYRGSLPDSVADKYLGLKELEARLQSVSDCSDVTYHRGYEEQSLELTPPVRNNTQRKYGAFNYKQTFAREAFCTVAKGGEIWFDGVNVVALDNQSNVIQIQSTGNTVVAYHAIKTTLPHKLEGTACFLDGRSSSIYYHWMLDVLPKLGVIQDAGISLADIDYFIVSAKSKFQLETLRACGVREEQLVFSDNTSHYQADTMIVPSLKNDQGEKVYYGLGVGLSSNVPWFLKKTFLPNQAAERSIEDRPVKLYISRSARGSRNIANEPVLVKALQARGFETVEFERLTVVQQAELMARAEVVVGVHGAGFTNLSFCKPGTQVIEIFGDYVVPCYWALCAVADLKYAQFMAKSIASPVAADNPGEQVIQLRDLEIDINVDEFIDYLDVTLDSAAAAA